MKIGIGGGIVTDDIYVGFSRAQALAPRNQSQPTGWPYPFQKTGRGNYRTRPGQNLMRQNQSPDSQLDPPTGTGIRVMRADRLHGSVRQDVIKCPQIRICGHKEKCALMPGTSRVDGNGPWL